MKYCASCKQDHAEESFHLNKTKQPRLQTYCIECREAKRLALMSRYHVDTSAKKARATSDEIDRLIARLLKLTAGR